ncbi:uncharacterized protein [Rutidosis leptorrhynchoides]|uniref:uncharacterized protein n=1 Tax=Rutidosis leptorrhynchoides TaxID=125765 RepID=UPI003A9A2519
MNLCAGTNCVSSKQNSWTWALSSSGHFTVKTLSRIIEDQMLPSSLGIEETNRSNLLPKKLEVFVWRAIKKRIPVRHELDKRGIDLHSVRCPLCDDDVETIEHSLIFCKYAMDVWNRVYSWCGLGNFSNLSISEILRGNTTVEMSKLGRKIWQAIEWVTSYFVWKNRNNKVFRDKAWTSPMTLSEIQLKSFEWISYRLKGKTLD